jgi:hypothetical protein
MWEPAMWLATPNLLISGFRLVDFLKELSHSQMNDQEKGDLKRVNA